MREIYACHVIKQQRQAFTVIVERDARAAVPHLKRSDDVTAVFFPGGRSQVRSQLPADATLVQLKN